MKQSDVKYLIVLVVTIVLTFLAFGCSSLLVSWDTSSSLTTIQEEPHSYNIGDQGPSGGLVFYDKGNYQEEWRYLEAAPQGWAGALYDPKAQWGAYPFNLQGKTLGNEIGSGLQNSRHIVNYNIHVEENRETYEQLPEAERMFSESHDGSVAAKVALNATINGFDDYFLPSQEELEIMRNTLYKNDVGSFQADMYWSSSMSNDRSGTAMNFWNGATIASYTNTSYYVRPIRKF